MPTFIYLYIYRNIYLNDYSSFLPKFRFPVLCIKRVRLLPHKNMFVEIRFYHYILVIFYRCCFIYTQLIFVNNKYYEINNDLLVTESTNSDLHVLGETN